MMALYPSLDIACGTGSQLVANRSAVPNARMAGLDRSLGMLRQARLKASDIIWVQADGATLPFPQERFDFITCQFGFHHLPDKGGMLRAVFNTLRHGGRLVIRNLCPQEHPDWLYYDYFPEAMSIDFADFRHPEIVVTTMQAIGFAATEIELEHLRFEQDMRAWLDTVRRRDTKTIKQKRLEQNDQQVWCGWRGRSMIIGHGTVSQDSISHQHSLSDLAAQPMA